MARRKRGAVQDVDLGMVIVEAFTDFEQYLPSIQDVHVFRRKMEEYVRQIVEKMGGAVSDDDEDEAESPATGEAVSTDE